MDWIAERVMIFWIALLLWVIAHLLVYGGLWLWRRRGRCRTETRLRELCKRVVRPNGKPAHLTTLGYHDQNDPHCPERLRNGATSSERTPGRSERR